MATPEKYTVKPHQVDGMQVNKDRSNNSEIVDWVRSLGEDALNQGDCIRIITDHGLFFAFAEWYVVLLGPHDLQTYPPEVFEELFVTKS